MFYIILTVWVIDPYVAEAYSNIGRTNDVTALLWVGHFLITGSVC